MTKYIALYEEFKEPSKIQRFNSIKDSKTRKGSKLYNNNRTYIIKILNKEAFNYWTNNKFNTNIPEYPNFITNDIYTHYKKQGFDIYIFQPTDVVFFINPKNDWYDAYDYKYPVITKLYQQKMANHFKQIGESFAIKTTGLDPFKLEKDIRTFVKDMNLSKLQYKFKTHQYERIFQSVTNKTATAFHIDQKGNLYISPLDYDNEFLKGHDPQWEKVGSISNVRECVNYIKNMSFFKTKRKLISISKSYDKSTNTYEFTDNIDISGLDLMSIDFGFNIKFKDPSSWASFFNCTSNFLTSLKGAPINVEPQKLIHDSNISQDEIDKYWLKRLEKNKLLISDLRNILSKAAQNTKAKNISKLDDFGILD